jgi:CNT family concentrative nucleoside transporter
VASWLFAPLACASGIPWSEAQRVGALLGTKTVLNQLLAFGELAAMPGDALSERTHVITTYALCGFANFGSVGIPVAGLATMMPKHRGEIARLGCAV